MTYPSPYLGSHTHQLPFWRCIRLRCATDGQGRARRGLGFDNCPVSACAQDLRAGRLCTSSSLPALPPCSCPLQVSHPGKVPVLEVVLSTSPVFDRNLWSPFTRRTGHSLRCATGPGGAWPSTPVLVAQHSLSARLQESSQGRTVCTQRSSRGESIAFPQPLVSVRTCPLP